MEKTDEKLAGLIEKLQDAGFAQAPEVIDGAIRAIYWDGTVTIVWAALWTLGTLFLLAVLCKWGKKIIGDSGDAFAALVVVNVGLLFITTLVSLIGNPWLKVIDPQAAFYQQIMESIF